MTRGRRHAEAGTATLESALVLPLLLVFLLAMADLGLWVFQTTQAAAGARDGARAGILSFHQADVTTSTDAAAIRAAIQRRIGSAPFGNGLTVQVQCVGSSQTTPVTGGCALASVLTRDRLDVKVTWDRKALSLVTLGFGITQKVSGRALMVVSDRPAGAGG